MGLRPRPPIPDDATLRAQIDRVIDQQGGPITFAQFMDCALYRFPTSYYRRSQSPIGRDFITSVSVSKLFGKLLAKRIEAFRQALGCPIDFEVVEFGSHRGQLAADIRVALPGVRYTTIDVGDDIPNSIVGCILSNEFLDALPVHRLQVKDGAWHEIYVERSGDTLQEVLGSLSDSRLIDAVAGLPVALMEGYKTEINLRAQDWLRDVSRRLKHGYILTIDYGMERTEYFSPHRLEGGARCYAQHQSHANFYDAIGAQDITSDVEFTTLMELGESLGLSTLGFMTQGEFIFNIIREGGVEIDNPRALHQLMHPALMGRSFRVLVQAKSRNGMNRELPTLE